MFYEFLQIPLNFFLISCVWENGKVEFQIMKIYIENHALGEKVARIEVNQILSQFKSQLI